jgi:GT2 family glycosyltransferase
LNYQNYKIILVDNGSTEGSIDVIRKKYNDIVLIKNKENLGYAEGNNVGISYALSNDADYIWLLNNDTVVDQNALETLVEVGENISECGILGSKIYYFDQPEIIWFAGATINWRKAVSNHIGQNQKDQAKYDSIREVERVTGCSMLVKRDVCERIGLMDENLFLYAEELDWCVRAKKAGYKILYVPDSKVYHKISLSTGDNYGVIFNYFNTRNFLYVIQKNMSFPKREYYLINALLYRISECRGILRDMIRSKFWSESKEMNVNMFKLRGVLDFLTGRMGKGYFKGQL